MRTLMFLFALCSVTACTTFKSDEFRRDLESSATPIVSSDSVVAGYPPQVFATLTDGAHVFVSADDSAGPRTVEATYEATLSTDTTIVLSGHELGPYVTMSVALRNVTAVYPVEKYPDYRTLSVGGKIMVAPLAMTGMSIVGGLLGYLIANLVSTRTVQSVEMGIGIGELLGMALGIYLVVH